MRFERQQNTKNVNKAFTVFKTQLFYFYNFAKQQIYI